MQSLVTRRADYIAVTAGSRSYPWRIIVCTDHDRELMDNDMVYRLAAPSRVADTGWIRPGKVAWDWWNDWNITHVDFRAGINTDTYKYYTDFAADNHIGYILLDEGWSDPTDLMKIVPGIDLPAIVGYARDAECGGMAVGRHAAAGSEDGGGNDAIIRRWASRGSRSIS